MSWNFASGADQRIFDIYMKTPYQLFDTQKERRQKNR